MMKEWERELKSNLKDRRLNGAPRGYITEEIDKLVKKHNLNELTVTNAYYRKIKVLLDREFDYLGKNTQKEDSLEKEQEVISNSRTSDQKPKIIFDQKPIQIAQKKSSSNKVFPINSTVDMKVVHVATYGFILENEEGQRGILHFSRIYCFNPNETFAFKTKDSAMAVFNRGILPKDNLAVKFILSVKVGDTLRVVVDESELDKDANSIRYRFSLKYDADQMSNIVNKTNSQFQEREEEKEKIILKLENKQEIQYIKYFIEKNLQCELTQSHADQIESFVLDNGSIVKSMELIINCLREFKREDIGTQFLNQLKNKEFKEYL